MRLSGKKLAVQGGLINHGLLKTLSISKSENGGLTEDTVADIAMLTKQRGLQG